MWFTPRHGGPQEYGFHWLLTLVANCYLLAALAFLCYLGWRAYLILRPPAAPATPTAGVRPQAGSAAGTARTPPRRPAS